MELTIYNMHMYICVFAAGSISNRPGALLLDYSVEKILMLYTNHYIGGFFTEARMSLYLYIKFEYDSQINSP